MDRIKLPRNPPENLYLCCTKSGCKRKFRNDRLIGSCGKTYKKCPYPENHKFMVRFRVSNLNKHISRILLSRDYQTALNESYSIVDGYKETGIEPESNSSQANHSGLLIDYMAEYIDFCNNIGVKEHIKKKRTSQHVKDIIKSLRDLVYSLKINSVNTNVFMLTQLDSIHAEYLYNYLTNPKEGKSEYKGLDCAPSTFNRKLQSINKFIDWAIKESSIQIENPFKEISRRQTIRKNITIYEDEFYALIKSISRKNGWGYERSKNSSDATRRNYWKPYLRAGILLSLLTNGRREEIISLKWSDIHYRNDEPFFIIAQNLKVIRQVGIQNAQHVQPKFFPITDNLLDLLKKLGHNRYKGKDRYLIVPNRNTLEPNVSDQQIMDNLSRGFSFFWRKLGIEREISFKHLRKTNLSYLHSRLKEKTGQLSSHTTEDVLLKHYVNPDVIFEGQGAEIFRKDLVKIGLKKQK